MEILPEREHSDWTVKKTIVRVFAYLFCIFLIWYGVDVLTKNPLTLKDKMRGSGMIVAACIYLFTDIRILILKIKQPNR